MPLVQLHKLLIKNNMDIKQEPNINNSKSYKKKSAKTFLVFLKFFNSVLHANNIIMMLNLNLFIFIKNYYYYKNVKIYNITKNFFISTNTNILALKWKYNIKKKKIKKIKKYRHIFVKPYINYISKILKKSCRMIIKFNFFKLLKIWFINKNINKKKSRLINFNNVYIYSKEISNCIFYFLNRISSFYFFKLNNLYKFFKDRFIKLKYQKLNIIKFLYSLKNNINLKLLIKIIKYVIDNIFNNNNKKFLQLLFFDYINKEYINIINHIQNRFINKISYLFNIYTDYNIIFKTYWNFSFIFKKKKQKKYKIKFLKKKKNNFIYIFNNLINKYMFFIFIYWVNLFFKECIPQSNVNLILRYDNNKSPIPIALKIGLYYEKSKFRARFKKLPKWCYLSYLKSSKFILYFKG